MNIDDIQDIVGINSALNIFYGYDYVIRAACIKDPYSEIYGPIEPLTKDEKIDLANKMINRWETYREECNET